MSSDPKPNGAAPEKYEEVVKRLDDVVRRLEGGQLSLEDSLKAFEEGIRLVQRGEKLLSDAEKRIEELLSEEGEDKTAPLGGPVQGAAREKAAPARNGGTADEDDIPF